MRRGAGGGGGGGGGGDGGLQPEFHRRLKKNSRLSVLSTALLLFCIVLPVAVLCLFAVATLFSANQHDLPNSDTRDPAAAAEVNGNDHVSMEQQRQHMSEQSAQIIQMQRLSESMQSSLDACSQELNSVKQTLHAFLEHESASGDGSEHVQPVPVVVGADISVALRGAGSASNSGTQGLGDRIPGGASESTAIATVVESVIRDAEFAFMLPSGRRPKGTFYAAQTVLALRRGGVPASSVLVFNAEGDGQHPELEHMRDDTLVNVQYPVNWLVRPQGTSFAMAPQWTSASIPSLISPQYKQAATDDPQRRRWRTKEAQDFMFVSQRALGLFPTTQWFVFLQDDAVYGGPDAQLAVKLRTIVGKPAVQKNGFVHLNPYGNVALLMHRALLVSFLGFAELRYHLIPIDWLLSEFLEKTLGIVENKSSTRGNRVFTHVGKVSSHEGNAERRET